MKIFKKICLMVLGTVMLGCGIGAFVATGMGSDSLSMLYDGASKTFGITVGTVSVIVNLIFLSCVFFMDKKKIGVSTIVCLFLCKYPIDWTISLYKPQESLVLNILIEIVLCFIMALGCALIVKADMGASAYDAFTLSISKVTKVKYTIIRYGCDFTWLILGWLLGGTIGIGTVLATICIGPMFSLCMKLLKVNN